MSKAPSGNAPPPSYSTVLRNRSFLALWLGRTASASGDFVFNLAAVWFILTSTGSLILVSAAFAAIFLPQILVGPVAGAYVDRWNRRNVLLVTYALQGLLVGVAGVLYVLHHLGYLLTLATILLLEVGHQFTVPAGEAILPGAVPQRELVPANGLLSASSSANSILSTGLGGILVGLLGVAIPFEYDALSFLVGLVVIATLPAALGRPTVEAEALPESAPAPGLIIELREGAQYLRRDSLLLRLAAVGTLVSFFAMGLQALYAPYVQRNLAGGAALYGFYSVSFALGSIAGGMLVGHLGRTARTGRLIILGLVGQGVGITLLGLTHLWWVALLLAAGIGVSQETNSVPWSALLQARIPRAKYGRVSTLIGTIINAPTPASVVATAFVAGVLSIGTTYTLYGLAMLACIAVAAASTRELLSLDVGERSANPTRS